MSLRTDPIMELTCHGGLECAQEKCPASEESEGCLWGNVRTMTTISKY